MSIKVNRRDFIGLGAAFAAGCATKPAAALAAEKPEYHQFSRVFQFIKDYERAAAVVKSCGYDGIEWTARPKGFIEPSLAPRYLKAAKRAAAECHIKKGEVYRLLVTE